MAQARELKFKPWPLLPDRPTVFGPRAPIGEKHNPDGTPNYAYLHCGRWWENADNHGMGRGWVRNERFGAGQVIPGARRKAKQ